MPSVRWLLKLVQFALKWCCCWLLAARCALFVSAAVHPWLWPPAPGSIVDNTGCLKVNIRDWVIIARSAQQALCPTTCHILVGSEMLDVGSLVTAWLDQGMQGARPLVMPRSEVRMLHARPLVCS